MFSWHAIPFARLLIPFIAGIFWSTCLPSGFLVPLAIALLLLSGLAYFAIFPTLKTKFQLRISNGLLFTLLILILAYSRTELNNTTYKSDYFRSVLRAVSYRIKVDDAVTEKEKYYRIYAEVDLALDSGGILSETCGKVLVYLPKSGNIKPQIGDYYIIRANCSNIEEPKNPGAFDYRQYLYYKHIQYRLYGDTSTCIKLAVNRSSIYRTACVFRDFCLDILRQNMNEREALGVAEALLLGYKDDIDKEILSSYAESGTIHVLAVSGMHAGLIYLILLFITRFLIRFRFGKLMQGLILLSALWMYAFMTGLSPSVLRATVMFSIVIGGNLGKRKSNIFNSIYASAFLMLVYDPYFLMDVGFQLSYLAVLGIVFIQPRIAGLFTPGNMVLKYIWDLLTVTLAAQVFTVPLSIYYFHRFPNYFILSNFLVIPLTSLALFTMVLLVAVFKFQVLSGLLGKLVCLCLNVCNSGIKSINKLPLASTENIYLDIRQMLLIYGISFMIFAFCLHKRPWQFFTVLFLFLTLSSIKSWDYFRQSEERLIIVHKIKGHEVFTCIDGFKAFVIGDREFIKNADERKRHLNVLFIQKKTREIRYLKSDDFFVSTNLMLSPDKGFKFYDITVTMQKYAQKSIHNHQITLISKYTKGMFDALDVNHNHLIFSNNINKFALNRIKNEYFERFGKSLNINSGFETVLAR